jgi:hypothetical protein
MELVWFGNRTLIGEQDKIIEKVGVYESTAPF